MDYSRLIACSTDFVRVHELPHFVLNETLFDLEILDIFRRTFCSRNVFQLTDL